MLCNIIVNKRSVKVVDINTGESQSLTFGSLSQLRFILTLLRSWCLLHNIVVNAKEYEEVVREVWGNIGGLGQYRSDVGGKQNAK